MAPGPSYGPRRYLTLPQRAPSAVRRPYGWGRVRPWGRKRWQPRSTSAAYRALAIARSLARDVEKKVVTIQTGTNDFYPAYLSGYMASLCTIAQGDQIYQRQGNKITFKRADLKVRCGMYAASNACYRVIVVQDLQQRDSTMPAISDILSQQNTLGCYNVLYTNRFKILYDQKKTLMANFANQDMQCEFDISLRSFAQGGRMEYSGAGGGTWSKNGLFLIVLADQAAAGDPTYQFQAASEADFEWNCLTYFTD